jgi:tetratricopeptide (TPR) repeat protein
MTQCTGTPAEQWLEAYLQGTLPEAKAQKFEQHYFDCPVCLAQVERLEAVSRLLGRRPLKASTPPIAWPARGWPNFSWPSLSWPARAFAVSAVAALFVVGFFGIRHSDRSSQPNVAHAPVAPNLQPQAQAATPTLAALAVSRLADLTLPVFRENNLRGSSVDAHFEAGMNAYANSDCAVAVKALSQVAAQDANARAAQFYLGVCRMHMGDLPAATSTLRKVAGAGESAQQEAALYYLAQIALSENDAATAHRYLNRTIALHGDFESRANVELGGLPASSGGR